MPDGYANIFPAAKAAIGMWLSLVERCVRDAEVAGSNPVTSTNDEGIPYFKEFLFTLS